MDMNAPMTRAEVAAFVTDLNIGVAGLVVDVVRGIEEHDPALGAAIIQRILSRQTALRAADVAENRVAVYDAVVQVFRTTGDLPPV